MTSSQSKTKAFRPTRKLVVEKEWSERGMNDGYWMLLKTGFHVDGAHAIHEDTKKAAYQRVKNVQQCNCVDCRAKDSVEHGAGKS